MFIIYSFSVGFSSLSHLVVLVLRIFSFRETENFYVSAMKRLRQEKTKSNQMLIKL